MWSRTTRGALLLAGLTGLAAPAGAFASTGGSVDESRNAFNQRLARRLGAAVVWGRTEPAVRPVPDSPTVLVRPRASQPSPTRPYGDLIARYSSRFGLDHALVSAIISVESAFKPRAVSSKGALGLMQIVPESGGRDAAARCGLRWPLPRETYFDPETNIMLGCAYLHLLLHDWFAEVRDKDTRHYLAISAYNAGVGNVAYKVASTRKLRGLVQLANRNTGPQMYRRLRADLSGIETGEYLEDVVAILEGS